MVTIPANLQNGDDDSTQNSLNNKQGEEMKLFWSVLW